MLAGMCGRYVATTDTEGLTRFLMVDERQTEDLPPNYNVAPTDMTMAVAMHDGKRVLTSFRWGLVPFWADDPKIGARMINARAESVAERSAFSRSFERRRCVIPADGFYEWERRPDGAKLPWFVHRADGEPMLFAGLWASWRDRGNADAERLLTCAIITTDANEGLRDVHDRMPVVLEPAEVRTWLDAQSTPTELQSLLVPAREGILRRHRVTTRVNAVRNNDPSLIEPMAEDDDGAADATVAALRQAAGLRQAAALREAAEHSEAGAHQGSFFD